MWLAEENIRMRQKKKKKKKRVKTNQGAAILYSTHSHSGPMSIDYSYGNQLFLSTDGEDKPFSADNTKTPRLGDVVGDDC